jgi:hypothetical protein
MNFSRRGLLGLALGLPFALRQTKALEFMGVPLERERLDVLRPYAKNIDEWVAANLPEHSIGLYMDFMENVSPTYVNRDGMAAFLRS